MAENNDLWLIVKALYKLSAIFKSLAQTVIFHVLDLFVVEIS